MAIAASPPRRSISAAVSSSSSVTQSQSRLRSPNGTSSARWPMANFGSVPMPVSSRCGRTALVCSARSSASVVHCCPPSGTYWRSSSQIGHAGGGASESGYWTPQATQMYRSATATRYRRSTGAIRRANRVLPPWSEGGRSDRNSFSDESRIDGHRASGRLAEVVALAEVDAELAHRLELVDALDALGHDLAFVLVGELDERGDQRAAAGRVLDAGGQRAVDLRDVGTQQLQAGERRAAAGEVVERDLGAALAVRLDDVAQQLAVGNALRANDLDAEAAWVGAQARDDRPGRADRGVDVQAGARVEVDEQHLALGQQRHAHLEGRGAGARVEREQGVVRLGGGEHLAAADLDGAELAAHQSLAAEGGAGVQVDDRLEVRRHLPVREELGKPVGAAAVEQDLGRHRQRLLVGDLHGEQARALGLRERAEQVLEAVLPARAGQPQALDCDVALDRLGRHVLDLVEHGRTMRQERHAVGAF